ncbi:DUF2934 domain-containing protein [Sphingomonas sp. S2-65]|uniref:DUF2934 domain-containing protein n=1 Tax=Sphingomonas sp. S2-65 TaxID=2903960 RepID=UPI001F378C71|nr:DUF2934 domain-containing protein [Sphingomonas sp. S2-65]UYY59189.1 DUF2934 domain-containing protein [Sphingomonas sp. S2-65]
MNDDREHEVRQRAYALWESEGRPEGRHDEHWHRANAGLGQDAPAPAENAPQQQAAAMPEAKPKPARRKPVAAGRAATETPAAVEESGAAPRKRKAVKPKAG